MTDFRVLKAKGFVVKAKSEDGIATFKLVSPSGESVANLKVMQDKIPDLVAWLTDALSSD